MVPQMTRHTVRAVVFDWAGTTVDYGCRAPASVFREIFARRDVPITEAQARGPMGSAKRDHIAAIASDPDVSQRWNSRYGGPPTDQDVQAMYDDFLPLQKETLKRHCELIPGAAEVFQALLDRNIAVGSNTGYTRELMEVVTPAAYEQGYRPAAVVCSDDVRYGRPAPWMFLETLHRLNAFPIWQCVKVDDTVVGIEAGRNAGAWTVALTLTGNEMGLSYEDAQALPAHERQQRLDAIAQKFAQASADYVIPSINELPQVLDDIEERLSQGELPLGCQP